jgi:hypothetical protein
MSPTASSRLAMRNRHAEENLRWQVVAEERLRRRGSISRARTVAYVFGTRRNIVEMLRSLIGCESVFRPPATSAFIPASITTEM